MSEQEIEAARDIVEQTPSTAEQIREAATEIATGVDAEVEGTLGTVSEGEFSDIVAVPISEAMQEIDEIVQTAETDTKQGERDLTLLQDGETPAAAEPVPDPAAIPAAEQIPAVIEPTPEPHYDTPPVAQPTPPEIAVASTPDPAGQAEIEAAIEDAAEAVTDVGKEDAAEHIDEVLDATPPPASPGPIATAVPVRTSNPEEEPKRELVQPPPPEDTGVNRR